MRLRDITIWFICVVLAASLLVVAGMQLDYINSQRYQMKLISNEPLENAPPSLAFATVAMGAFRGLVVDVLWMRADRLKEEGQFFDARQLAEWITTLQPRFSSVWEFQAWNMAYNISVTLPASEPDQRWQWVKNGYELLRDKGIPLNPKAILLYRQLALIFQHKIGFVSDEAHKYYKLQLATAMEPLLGPADDKYFDSLAEAPNSWQQIVEDANVTPLIKALKSADEAFADDDMFVSNYLSLRQNPARFEPAAFEVIDDFRGQTALKRFDIFAKAHQLRSVWKLDPVMMRRLNKTYGPVEFSDPNRHLPLDWRHPDSHAIYWAIKGLEVAGNKEVFNVDESNTDRIVNHSLQNLFRNGKIFIYNVPAEAVPDDSSQSSSGLAQPPAPSKEVYLRSDLRMFESYNKSTLARIEKYKDLRENTYNSLRGGHYNMVKNAIFSFYQAGDIPQAQKIYDQLKKLYPEKGTNVPLVTFVRRRLDEELTSIGLNNANEIVQMMLRESYFRYAIRDDDAAFAREKMAKEIHDHYQSAYLPENRIDLPELKLLKYLALLDFLNDQRYPRQLRLGLIGRIKIERPELAEQFSRQEEKMLKELEQSQQQP